jgi:outer membrane biosynthesis protein TonB
MIRPEELWSEILSYQTGTKLIVRYAETEHAKPEQYRVLKITTLDTPGMAITEAGEKICSMPKFTNEGNRMYYYSSTVENKNKKVLRSHTEENRVHDAEAEEEAEAVETKQPKPSKKDKPIEEQRPKPTEDQRPKPAEEQRPKSKRGRVAPTTTESAQEEETGTEVEEQRPKPPRRAFIAPNPPQSTTNVTPVHGTESAEARAMSRLLTESSSEISSSSETDDDDAVCNNRKRHRSGSDATRRHKRGSSRYRVPGSSKSRRSSKTSSESSDSYDHFKLKTKLN